MPLMPNPTHTCASSPTGRSTTATPNTGKVFTVLFEIPLGGSPERPGTTVPGGRVREYRFDATPVAHGGVAQNGGYFVAINYARMARLRPVTAYQGARDWIDVVAAPATTASHAPCWHRTGDALVAPGIAPDSTRQMFVIELREHE